MSVLISDVVIYGAANMVTTDGTTVGGAVDFGTRVAFNDINPNGTMDYYSDSASDTATTIALTGRDASGAIQTETKTLTGTTAVAGSQTFERILESVAAGTTAVGNIVAVSHTNVVTGTAQGGSAATSSASATITLQSGQGASVALQQIVRITNNTPSGAQHQLRYIVAISSDTISVNSDWGTVPSSATTYAVQEGVYMEVTPNQVKKIIRPLEQLSSNAPGGADLTFYSKMFVVNNNTATSLTSATVTIASETPSLPGSTTLQIALTNALNDTATVANRQTAPATGITAFTTGSAPQTINVPSPGNLPGGAASNSAGAEGIWLKLFLPAGSAAYKGAVSIQTTGQTV